MDIYNKNFYNIQFVQNETTSIDNGDKVYTSYNPLDHCNYCKGTLTGVAYIGDSKIQTFVANENGDIALRDIGFPKIKIVNGCIDENGIISLEWNENPGPNHAVVSYEYEMQIPCKKQKDLYFEIPTFEKFFDSRELAEIKHSAGTICQFNFNHALGDTINEKYESLYVKLIELTQVLIAKGAKGFFWIATSPDIASMFEVSVPGFNINHCKQKEKYNNLDVDPMGIDLQGVTYCGAIHRKWRIYTDSEIDKQTLIIGCNDEREEDNHYGCMTICNYIL